LLGEQPRSLENTMFSRLFAFFTLLKNFLKF